MAEITEFGISHCVIARPDPIRSSQNKGLTLIRFFGRRLKLLFGGPSLSESLNRHRRGLKQISS